MQPQGPPGQNSQSPNGAPPPYYPQQGPQGPAPQPGQPYPGGQPYPQAPGQQFAPGQPTPQIPGQPAIPQYQMPQNLRKQAGQPDLPPPPAAATTPYDFFMDQPKPATPIRPLSPSGKHLGNIPMQMRPGGGKGASGLGSGKNAKFLFIAAGGIVVVIGLILFSALAPKDQTGPQLFGIAQTQQEVIRVCNLGTNTKAKLRATRNFAITCATGVLTDQNNLATYIKSQKYAYNGKLLGGKANTKTDSQLNSATSSSTFDNTFRDILEKQLTSYDNALKQQLAVTTGVKARDVLSKSQSNADILVQMVKDDSDQAAAVDDVGATQ